eukprot:4208038-Prymnesium_polylepis.1
MYLVIVAQLIGGVPHHTSTARDERDLENAVEKFDRTETRTRRKISREFEPWHLERLAASGRRLAGVWQ